MAFSEVFHVLDAVNERLCRPAEKKSILSSYFDGHLEFQERYVDPSPSPEPPDTPNEVVYAKDKLDVPIGSEMRYGASSFLMPRKRKRAPDSCEPTSDNNSSGSDTDLKVRRKKRKFPAADIPYADTISAYSRENWPKHQNPRPKTFSNNGRRRSRVKAAVFIGGYPLRRTSARTRKSTRQRKPTG